MFQRKIIKYKLIYDNDINELEKEINRLLKKGWELYGNTYSDSTDYQHQPMVLYDDSINGDKNIKSD